MGETVDNNKRIARNTLFLYIRMFIMMGVSLFTSRITLSALGEEDFGIYNIVGGIVVLFSFLNSALTTATQRFLNYEIGKENEKAVNQIFCMSMNIYIGLSIIIIVLSETIGLWFLNTQMNIPENRMQAAYWVYQFSILSFIINLIRVPYNATIIAYEKMSFFAYLSMIEVMFKLISVYYLYITSSDKLIIIAILYTIIPFLINIVYKKYCNTHFTTSQFHLFWNKILFKKLTSFSIWNFFGSLANIGATQGINIILNIFWGVTVNAAAGIANQLANAVNQFVTNFQTAFNPQLVKLYASGNKEAFIQFIFQSSKFSYYLLFIIALPVMINSEFLLGIWLGNIPQYTADFCKWILIFMLIDAISSSLWMSVQATGNIRNYQILVSLFISMNIPIAYILSYLGFPPISVWIGKAIINFIVYIFRIFYLKRVFGLPTWKYIYQVLSICTLITLLSIPLPLYIQTIFSGWTGLIPTTLCSIVVTVSIILLLGLNKVEKQIAFQAVNKFIHKITPHS